MKSWNEAIRAPGAILRVSVDGTGLVCKDGKTFFWLADTAWLINARLEKAQMIEYLDDRADKGFSVIQVMAVHSLEIANAYGDRAIPESFLATSESGKLDSGLASPGEGYWETLDFLFGAAADRGIYIGLVPVWGSVVQRGLVPVDAARWLDFNMFQSGHRDYNQRRLHNDVPVADDGPDTDVWHGEDNWRYVLDDIALEPQKPTLDGEPSYEDIPHGLHDFSQPRWTDADCRRYAYWSLLAGACGHTYGHNSIMQFHEEGAAEYSFGVGRNWREALNSPGSRSMTHVRALVEALGGGPFVHDPGCLATSGGERYARRIAARAGVAAVVYAYSGGTIALAPDAYANASATFAEGEANATDASAASAPKKNAAWWYDPRSGETCHATASSVSSPAGISDPSSVFKAFGASAILEIRAPGPEVPGNDWILVVEPKGENPPFDARLRSAAGLRMKELKFPILSDNQMPHDTITI